MLMLGTKAATLMALPATLKPGNDAARNYAFAMPDLRLTGVHEAATCAADCLSMAMLCLSQSYCGVVFRGRNQVACHVDSSCRREKKTVGTLKAV